MSLKKKLDKLNSIQLKELNKKIEKVKDKKQLYQLIQNELKKV